MIEVGLRLDQVTGSRMRADQPKENLKSVGDDRLRECGATEEEIDFLRDRRVELNALTTEQLVELVEGALAEHGIGKVIPDAKDLAAAWRAAKAHAEIAAAVEEANKRAERWRKSTRPMISPIGSAISSSSTPACPGMPRCGDRWGAP